MRMRRLAGAIAGLALLVTTMPGASTALADTTDLTVPVKRAQTGNYTMPCASMAADAEEWRGLPVEWVEVDVQFRAKIGGSWVTIRQAVDGTQFRAHAFAQIPYWACAPTQYRVAVPDSWVS